MRTGIGAKLDAIAQECRHSWETSRPEFGNHFACVSNKSPRSIPLRSQAPFYRLVNSGLKRIEDLSRALGPPSV